MGLKSRPSKPLCADYIIHTVIKWANENLDPFETTPSPHELLKSAVKQRLLVLLRAVKIVQARHKRRLELGNTSVLTLLCGKKLR